VSRNVSDVSHLIDCAFIHDGILLSGTIYLKECNKEPQEHHQFVFKNSAEISLPRTQILKNFQDP
jgi:hypothetical protein